MSNEIIIKWQNALDKILNDALNPFESKEAYTRYQSLLKQAQFKQCANENECQQLFKRIIAEI